MIKFFSTRTGQSIGAVSIAEGEVSLSPAAMRNLMKTLADSDVGHLFEFTFDGLKAPATCLFGARAINEINAARRKEPKADDQHSDFTPL